MTLTFSIVSEQSNYGLGYIESSKDRIISSWCKIEKILNVKDFQSNYISSVYAQWSCFYKYN